MSRQTPPENRSVLTRRRFATGAAAAALALVPLGAQAENTTAFPDPSASPAEIGSRPGDLSLAEWAEVHGRYNNVLRVYGSRLSAEEKQRVIHILTANERMLSSIRGFEVGNGDASACTLRLRDTKS